ncbi:hypothetical protein AMR72_16295 [Flavobacterium psychrophilum]|nr:hypothetical protein AMR72_16295 [Flavobacterium psychrophilum]AOE53925.1 hypothetical protein ALW18_16285 [Flavobacterium psychrophilum]
MDSANKIRSGQIKDHISPLVQAALDLLTSLKANQNAVVLKGGNSDGTTLSIGTNDAFNMHFEISNTRKMRLTATTVGIVEGVALVNDTTGDRFTLSIGTQVLPSRISNNLEGNVGTLQIENIHPQNVGNIIEFLSSGSIKSWIDKSGHFYIPLLPSKDNHAASKQYADNLNKGKVTKGGDDDATVSVGTKGDKTARTWYWNDNNPTLYEKTTAGAVGHVIHSIGATKDIVQFRGDDNVPKAGVTKSGYIYAPGIIIPSPNGNQYILTPSNDGQPVFTLITPPV